MTTYTADHYSATTQAIRDVIARSISHDEIVHLECLSPATAEAIVDELERESEGSIGECESSREGWTTREYWGADYDRNEWRVHVEMRTNGGS